MSTSKERGAKGQPPRAGGGSQRHRSPPSPPPEPSFHNPWEEFKGRMFRRIKLPGWMLVVSGIIVDFLVWRDVVQFVAAQVRQLGQWVAVVTLVFGSPVFGSILVLSGVLYLIFVGEPKEHVLRSRLWSYLAWTTVGVLSVIALGIGEAAWVAGLISPIRILTSSQKLAISRGAGQLLPLMAAGGQRLSLDVASIDTPEANGYASQIMDALKAGGVESRSLVQNMSVPQPVKVTGTGLHGVCIQVRDPNAPPVAAQVLRRTLNDAGIPVCYITDMVFGPDNYVLTVFPP
jgi:hypothetical protein